VLVKKMLLELSPTFARSSSLTAKCSARSSGRSGDPETRVFPSREADLHSENVLVGREERVDD
jgi:hypothetical protein